MIPFFYVPYPLSVGNKFNAHTVLIGVKTNIYTKKFLFLDIKEPIKTLHELQQGNDLYYHMGNAYVE